MERLTLSLMIVTMRNSCRERPCVCLEGCWLTRSVCRPAVCSAARLSSHTNLRLMKLASSRWLAGTVRVHAVHYITTLLFI